MRSYFFVGKLIRVRGYFQAADLYFLICDDVVDHVILGACLELGFN